MSQYINTIIQGRNDYQPKVRNMITTYGNHNIIKMVIVRNPLSALLTASLNVVSLGAFSRRFSRLPYDKLFHLQLFITLENNTTLSLEKNEVINMVLNPKLPNGSQQKQINEIPHGITLNSLLENGKNIQDGKWFKYSAYDNNCQDFIMALLKGSNIGNEQDYNFVKQDTASLFKNDTLLRKTANTVTDLAAKINVITQGAGINPHNNIQSVLFKKPEWTKRRAINWLIKHGFRGIDVDEKTEHLRFRQRDPQEMENQGFKFITKPLHKNIELIIGYQNNKTMPRKSIKDLAESPVRDFESDSDSDSCSDTSSDSGSDMDEREIKNKMKDLRKHIKRHHKLHGGKLNIAKSFKKLGDTLKKGFEPVGKYITAKKGGLASDLLHQGVPIVTGALGAAAGEYVGGPLGGLVGSELGSKAGQAGADALGKKIGVGLKKRGRPPKASGSGDLIHIDIGSHNAKGKTASNKMEGGRVRHAKGSQEAKEHMARLRAMRKNK